MTRVRDVIGQGRTDPAAPRHGINWRVVTFVTLTVVYALLTVAVVHHTWVLRVDAHVYDLHIKRDYLTHAQYETIYWYVTLGQRGPATLVFLPYFIWTAYRLRSARPLVLLGVALLLLNLTVGAVKLATGRLGPREIVNVYKVFSGGNIYPSGHVSNAVVLYGLVAWISLRHRKLFIAGAVWIAVTVGLGTVAINTHWFSDVVGGWLAGGLVLLALPWFVPPAERLVDRAYGRLARTRSGRRVARRYATWRAARGHATASAAADPPRTSRAVSGRAPEHRRATSANPRSYALHDRPRSASEERDAGQLDSTSP